MSGQKIMYVDENGQPIAPEDLHLYEVIEPEKVRPEVEQQLRSQSRPQTPTSRKAVKRKRRLKLFRKKKTVKKVVKKTKERSQSKKKQKRKRRFKFGRIFILLLMVLAVLVVYHGSNFEVVVMGLDTSATREEVYGRTDSLMAVSVKPLERTALMVSIPRDTYTPITCLDNESDKINHAHAFGGTDCTLSTVNQFLEIDTTYYVKTNFEGVVSLIETLGGVPITVQGTFCEQDSQDNPDAYCFNDGEQRVLNGEEALAYARHRKTDGDEMRQVRQQQLLTAAIKQTLTPAVLLTKIPALITAANQIIETNVPIAKILWVAPWFLIQPQIQSLRIEGEGMMIDGIWYLAPDETSVSAAKAEL